jgi:SMI1 / KNR4 family (SUKH-1)
MGRRTSSDGDMMVEVDWLAFLRQYNAELLASVHVAEAVRYWDEDGLPAAVRSGWLGLPGASEEQLASAERRLGVSLPPSYRAFLSVSNGWWYPGAFVPRLWTTEEIEWLAVTDPGLIEAWSDAEPVSDEEYFVYGEEQSELTVRSEYMEHALRISELEVAGTAVYLLIPDVVTPEGEWEAWMHAHWLPGARRYRSFRELMEAERASFLRLEEHDAKRMLPTDAMSQLPVKLPNLIDELVGKARLIRDLSAKTPSANRAWEDETAAGLEQVAGRVHQLQAQRVAPETLMASLQALREEMLQEHRDVHAPRAKTMFTDVQELHRASADMSRAEGLRQAAGLIEWFLRDTRQESR